MSGIQYGYIRVSSKDQNTNRQWDELLKFGIPAKHIFVDKQSGKDFNRPNYKKLIRLLHPNDCIVITSLDRLGRNYTDVQEQWRNITKVKGADVIVLDMPLLNTRQHRHTLLGKFLSDMVLQLLSYVAETERNNIRKRQAEGIAAAKARGVQFGRKSRPLPDDFYLVVGQWQRGQITAREAAKRLHVSCSWLYRKINALNI